MKATARDLRLHSKELLETVGRGEEVVITYRGKPRAKLIPCEGGERRSKAENELFGLWRDRTDMGDVSDYVRSLRKSRF